jgi:hypothetical protein
VDEARATAFDYIECYYNRVRRHSTLGTTIPKFEQSLKTKAGCGNMEKPQSRLSHIPTTTATIHKPKTGEIRDISVLNT